MVGSMIPGNRGRMLLLSLAVSFFIILSIFSRPSSLLAASKSLLLTPTRIIFTDRQRSVELHVNNTGDEAIRYKISLVTLRPGKGGQLHVVEEESAAEKLVKSMIRYSPRRATIGPRQRQIVKLMVRKPSALPPGEYRTYISISPLPSEGGQAGHARGGSHKSTFEIDFLVTTNLPIIIQHGNIAPEVVPTGFRLRSKNKEGVIGEVTLERKGIGSGFGNVRLEYIPKGKAREKRTIAFLQGVAIYQPDGARTLAFALKDMKKSELSSGSVRVTFESSTASGLGGRRERSKTTFKNFPL